MKARREHPKRIQPEYHLIVTEGTNTEPAYFEAIKEKINVQYRGRVQLDIFGEGDNTVNLFKRTRQHVLDNPNGYRHVWVVYDTDDFPAAHIDKVPKLCDLYSTEETEYHAVWSNQCVELWYLLHFSFMRSDLHRMEYWHKLSKRLIGIGAGIYEKNRVDMYVILEPFMDSAIENAKKLAVINEGKEPSQSAPGTKIYELVEKLRAYL